MDYLISAMKLENNEEILTANEEIQTAKRS